MQPRLERALPAKGIQLPKHPDEHFLAQVLGFHDISGHPQAHGINFSVMESEEFLEGR
jgi:hypothetical protein